MASDTTSSQSDVAPNMGESERAKSKELGTLRRLWPFLAPYKLMVIFAGFALRG